MADPNGYDGGNTTGFVSPAGDSLEGPIDLSEALDLRRPHRYAVRVAGEALTARGILPGDVLIVDASAPPAAGKVAVVMIHGEVWVAQIGGRDGQWWLRPGRADRPAVPIDGDAEVWAIVDGLVRLRV